MLVFCALIYPKTCCHLTRHLNVDLTLVELALNLDLAPQLSFSNLEAYIHQQEKKLTGMEETDLTASDRPAKKKKTIPRQTNKI